MHRVGIDKAGRAVKRLDLVSAQLLLPAFPVVRDDVFLVAHEVFNRRLASERERSTPKSLRERQPESASAVSCSVLLGIVPVLIPAPPTLPSFSTSATRFPKIAAVLAPQMPAGPPPITTRSKSLVIDARHRGE
jgi:hypothetical protein